LNILNSPKYKRVLLKLSGEALMGDEAYGISPTVLKFVAQEVKSVVDLGVETALVVGGGNIFRGMAASSNDGMDRSSADYLGMLATVMNSLALQDALEKLSIPTRVQSAITIRQMAEPYIRRRAMRHLEKGRVVIFAAGTGNPYFTTDTAAVLRALEIKADVLLKGTRVDGIYSADPEKHPDAVKYDRLTFDEAWEQGLKIMDLTAFSLCKENNLPVIVFNMNKPGNLVKAARGEAGTIVSGRL